MLHAERELIVNADDFGMSVEVNAGIEQAFLQGVVTSASLMVRRPAAARAAAFAARHPHLSLGLHLDLGEWAFRDGHWVMIEEVVRLDDPVEVRREIESQVDAFRRLTGDVPTHLDSHQHVHLTEPVRGEVLPWGSRLGVPVRGLTTGLRFCGDFYGQTGEGRPLPHLISVEALMFLLDQLPVGRTELGCHPGGPAVTGETYGPERAIEAGTLTDPRISSHLESCGIALVSHHDAGARCTSGETVAPTVGVA